MAQTEAELAPKPTITAAPLSMSDHPPLSGPAGEELQPSPPSTFVAMSRFRIANDMTADVKEAFRDRPHLVDDAPGFLRMEVISPLDAPEEIWLLTYWSDEASYRTWHHGHTYRDSHRGIPKGLRLDPKGTEIRFFEHVCS